MAVLKTSRYSSVEQIDAPAPGGGTTKAFSLRPLPSPDAAPYLVLEHDRLDTLAQNRYADGSRFWHIADANTELEANQLAAPGRTIALPLQ
jgi:hypothetical protein